MAIQKGLKDNLIYEGYNVMAASNGKKGLKLALNEDSDLILLDIMLPGIGGHEICKKIKIEKPETPVIMITARDSEMDKISGLDIGADDYITKPFSIPELMARIRAVMRRYETKKGVAMEFVFGNVKLDFKKLQAFRFDKEISLTSREYDYYLLLT